MCVCFLDYHGHCVFITSCQSTLVRKMKSIGADAEGFQDSEERRHRPVKRVTNLKAR
jgi:hypothetical protein